MRHIAFFLLAAPTVFLAASAAAGPAESTWPTYAHDFNRTARAAGYGEMSHPAVAWTEQLGGVLGARDSYVDDVDGDGRPNIISITGGRVVVSNPDGSTLWKGVLTGARGILGVWNLDGAGGTELVLDTPAGVQILTGATGALLATLAVPSLPTATFVAEAPRGGILVLSVARGTVSAYDFRSGISSVPSPLWTLYGANPAQYIVGDLDGDGNAELVRALEDGFDAVDPLTGAVKYGPVSVGPLAYLYMFQLANLDGRPGNEIVAVDFSYIYSPSAGIYALGVRNGALATMWSSSVDATVALATTDFTTVAGAARDLDGDGSVEVLYSQLDGATGLWTTNIVDGSTGSNLAQIPGQIIQAVGDVDGDSKSEIVTRANPLADQTPARTTVTAYDFDSRLTGPVAKPWSLSSAHVLARANEQSVGPYAYLSVPILADFDSAVPGLELLIGQDEASAQVDTRLMTVHGADGTIAGQYPIPAGSIASGRWIGDKLAASTSSNDVLAFTNDGILNVQTRTLSVTASLTAGTYSNWVYVNRLTPGRPAVFAATSTNDLLWLDGKRLHANGVPYEFGFVPSVAPTSGYAAAGCGMDPVVFLDGPSPTLVAVQQGETSETLIGMDISGIEFWTTTLAPGTRVELPGAYVSDFTGDGNPDLLLPLENINSLMALAIFDGTNGHLVRSTPIATIVPNADGLVHGSLVDLNGDGTLELVAPIQDTGIVAINIQSNPMTTAWVLPYSSQPSPMDNGTIGAGQLDSSPALDLFRVGGNNGDGVHGRLNLAGQVVAIEHTGLPFLGNKDQNYAALVLRTSNPDTFDLVTVGNADAALSRVRRTAGDTMQPVWTVYASNGAVSPTPPSAMFALHDPLATDINNDGHDDVVFGSDDGFLYAVSASDGSLVFATFLDAPVEHVIAADVDNDPALELVASLGDGRLVAIDEKGHYDAFVDTSFPTSRGPFPGAAIGGGSVGAGSAVTDTGAAGGCQTTLAPRTDSGSLGVLLLLGAGAVVRRRRRIE